ncbi:MAG: prepilin-type N-terminal cleavage/methylation domain-containing protein [bacterium]|nr:prepilin-type N-terminal cleavage/methylation domain-containing protein [bacterium]
MDRITSKKFGFTMIEVMGAIFILSVGILGSYIIIQNTLALTFSSASRLSAAYLAEEGIEIVRNIRDTNWVSGNSWDYGLADGSYQVSYNDYSLSPYSTGLVNYAAGSNNKFRRRITLSMQTDGSIEVVSEVMWQERGGVAGTVISQSYLYDWK